jgi:MFS family permease
MYGKRRMLLTSLVLLLSGSVVCALSDSLAPMGGALGLPTAAIIADNVDWHVLFWTSAALGAVALALVLAIVPESKVRTGGRFDPVGSLGMAAGRHVAGAREGDGCPAGKACRARWSRRFSMAVLAAASRNIAIAWAMGATMPGGLRGVGPARSARGPLPRCARYNGGHAESGMLVLR